MQHILINSRIRLWSYSIGPIPDPAHQVHNRASLSPLHIIMKIRILLPVFASLALSLSAITPEAEKAFVDSYKKAYEANDAKTLASFLLTEGASAETIEFITMMQTAEAGSKLSSITLETISAEEAKRKSEPMEMPDGKRYVMPFTPTHQLVLKTETKDASGSSTSTSKMPVAEHKGKIVILVPVPAK